MAYSDRANAVHYEGRNLETNLDLMGAAASLVESLNDRHTSTLQLDRIRASYRGSKPIVEAWPEINALGFAVGENSIGLRLFVELYTVAGSSPPVFRWQINASLRADAAIPADRCPLCTQDIARADLEGRFVEACDEFGFCNRCLQLLRLKADFRHEFVRAAEVETWPHEHQVMLMQGLQAVLAMSERGTLTPDTM